MGIFIPVDSQYHLKIILKPVRLQVVHGQWIILDSSDPES